VHIRRTHLGMNDAPEIDRLLIDESGATAIEYGLIASGIAVALIAAVKGVGTNLKTTFGSISTAVK
jgi:pilus assembly protein Flp/PilA